MLLEEINLISIKVSKVSTEIGNLRKAFRSNELKAIRKECMIAVEELKIETPVDTGFAKSQWKLVEEANVFKIENKAPYIDFLNAGSSQKAPKYFVERVMLRHGKPVGTIVQYQK